MKLIREEFLLLNSLITKSVLSNTVATGQVWLLTLEMWPVLYLIEIYLSVKYTPDFEDLERMNYLTYFFMLITY